MRGAILYVILYAWSDTVRVEGYCTHHSTRGVILYASLHAWSDTVSVERYCTRGVILYAWSDTVRITPRLE